MSIKNLLKVAINAILSNKFRSFLSMLGIIIGVAAVIIMMAIGQGSKQSVRAELSKMGTNLLTLRPGADMRGGVRRDPSSMQTLKMADYQSLLSDATLVTHISPEVASSGQVIYGANNTTTSLYGESPEYLDIKLWTVEEGDCFNEEDVKKSAKVCVVGRTIVKELFGDKDAPCVGKTIRFKSIPFRIVGVLKAKGYNSWGMDQDNVIIAPYTTVMKRIAAQTYFNSINMSALSEDLSDAAIEEITGIIRHNHKLKDDADTLAAGDDGDYGKHHGYYHHHHGSGGSFLAAGCWHRHHEYHAGECDRAYQGDRTAHVGRSTRGGYPESVPHREHHDIPHGSSIGSGIGLRRQLDSIHILWSAQRCALLECGRELLPVCIYRSVLRLCACPQGCPNGPHRGYQI